MFDRPFRFLAGYLIECLLINQRDAIRFAQDVKNWMKMSPENIIAIHCKGGKGKSNFTNKYSQICTFLNVNLFKVEPEQ